MSDIQDYIEYIIKKHEILTTTPPIHVYINRINNRLVFKIENGYKLELQTPETMKLFGSIKKLIDKTKSGEKVPSPEINEKDKAQKNVAFENNAPFRSCILKQYIDRQCKRS